jgi:hypothetical protein
MATRHIYATSTLVAKPPVGPYLVRLDVEAPDGRRINHEERILQLYNEQPSGRGLLVFHGLRPDGSTQALYVYEVDPADIGDDWAAEWLTAAEHEAVDAYDDWAWAQYEEHLKAEEAYVEARLTWDEAEHVRRSIEEYRWGSEADARAEQRAEQGWLRRAESTPSLEADLIAYGRW